MMQMLPHIEGQSIYLGKNMLFISEKSQLIFLKCDFKKVGLTGAHTLLLLPGCFMEVLYFLHDLFCETATLRKESLLGIFQKGPVSLEKNGLLVSKNLPVGTWGRADGAYP